MKIWFKMRGFWFWQAITIGGILAIFFIDLDRTGDIAHAGIAVLACTIIACFIALPWGIIALTPITFGFSAFAIAAFVSNIFNDYASNEIRDLAVIEINDLAVILGFLLAICGMSAPVLAEEKMKNDYGVEYTKGGIAVFLLFSLLAEFLSIFIPILKTGLG